MPDTIDDFNFNPDVSLIVDGTTHLMKLHEAQQEYDRIYALDHPSEADNKMLAALTIALGTVTYPATCQWAIDFHRNHPPKK